MLPHPQSIAKTGSAWPALQRERQPRSSGFPNQSDNLNLRWCSRKAKNFSISGQTGAFIVVGGDRGVPANREKPPRTNVVLKPTL